MKIRGPAGVGGADPIRSIEPLRTKAVKGTRPPSAADRVEISQMARFLDRISRLPDIRHEKVDAVRREIAKGTYVTAEKLAQAIDNLLAELW